MPILHQFKPDLILVSCGFDSGEGDVIGSMHLNSHGYIFMTQQLLGLNKPLGLILEGGYNLDVLQWASKSIARAVTDQLTAVEK
jgi:acetoin utilization deacetylase AcuC-like enzyme